MLNLPREKFVVEQLSSFYANPKMYKSGYYDGKTQIYDRLYGVYYTDKSGRDSYNAGYQQALQIFQHEHVQIIG